MEEVIGRAEEKDQLNKLLDSKTAVFLALYGRRRIGKTFLIKNHLRNKGLFFHLTGVRKASTSEQLRNFKNEHSDRFYRGRKIPTPHDWLEAFQMLRKELELLPKTERAILFFDELPWLASPKSGFLSALDFLWNRYLCDMPNVMLIVCGSAASWMIDHVINDQGGLHGRVTHEIRLAPFTLCEVKQYLNHRNIKLRHKQICELYMVLGGVARYWSYVERGLSVTQLIGQICFSHNAPLLSEFHKLYRSLFKGYEDQISIVKALAKKRCGLTFGEISQATGIPKGGSLTQKLHELTESSFICKTRNFGGGEQAILYHLIDEYSLFYLTWLSEVPTEDLLGTENNYWSTRRNQPDWISWTGYAFELICLKHVDRIKKALGLYAVHTSTSKWKYQSKEGKKGAEIDLVLDRADQCINLIEIKFYKEEWSLTKKDAQALVNKQAVFERETRTRKSTFITLLTTHGTKHNDFYHEVVDQELTMDALF